MNEVSMSAGLPYNTATGLEYQGRNAGTLGSGEWGTFLQWRAKGMGVRKGEHGRAIMAVGSTVQKKNKITGAVEDMRAVRWYTVFSTAQVAPVSV
jgi:antirestriction protein ArdC